MKLVNWYQIYALAMLSDSGFFKQLAIVVIGVLEETSIFAIVKRQLVVVEVKEGSQTNSKEIAERASKFQMALT